MEEQIWCNHECYTDDEEHDANYHEDGNDKVYLDNNGQVNDFITAGAGDSAIAGNIHVELKSTTKLPTDGTPTCIILTVDTTLHSGNAKLF